MKNRRIGAVKDGHSWGNSNGRSDLFLLEEIQLKAFKGKKWRIGVRIPGQFKVVASVRSNLTYGSWLMAHGSWLMAHGSAPVTGSATVKKRRDYWWPGIMKHIHPELSITEWVMPCLLNAQTLVSTNDTNSDFTAQGACGVVELWCNGPFGNNGKRE